MPSKRDFSLVGVTGGIGSGKSVVCRAFEELGREVLWADDLAREITNHDTTVIKRVRQVFGPSSYTPEGLLDRKVVAARAFSDPAAMKRLDAIVHPVVFKAITTRVSQLPPERQHPYVIVEAALIYESGMDEQLEYVIVVHAEEETRINRVMRRDNCTREEVLRRIASQMTQDEKVKRADFVIRNDSDTTPVLPRVQFIDVLLRQMIKQA